MHNCERTVFFESEVGSVVVVVQSLVIQMKFTSSNDMEHLGSSYEICEFECSFVNWRTGARLLDVSDQIHQIQMGMYWRKTARCQR